MEKKLMNLIGETYGFLTVIKEVEPIPTKNNQYVRRWLCSCECGTETVVRHSNLRSKSTSSCGCHRYDREDLTGKTFTRLTVVERGRDIKFESSTKSTWLCECDCGNIIKVTSGALKSGNTKSCGCYKRDMTIKSNKENKTKHGLCSHPLYSTWSNMNRRCYNSNSEGYKYYGARGISVCEEWQESPNGFIEWAVNETDWYDGCGLSLDRIDVNGNYEPRNCRFTSHTIQAYNQRIPSNNTTGYRGVYKKGNKWVARISINGKDNHLGSFERIEEAAEARQLKEIEIFGKLLPETKIATDKVLETLKHRTD